MPRFFIEGVAPVSGYLKITGEDVNHIKNVLRLKKNEIITVSDARGTDYTARIEEIAPDFVNAIVIEQLANSAEANVEITLFQGLPKSDKMDSIIQKCVELGVKKIIPVENERSVVKLAPGKEAVKKTERWQRIALEAAKQCGRGIIPEVGLSVSFKKALEVASLNELSIIPYENEKTAGIKSLIKNRTIKSVAVFIGPEGGFTDAEIKAAAAAGLIPVTLGPRILRTETAGPAAAAILMYELGDMGE